MGNVIYIDKGYHKKISEKIYKNLRENRCSIILLDEENGVDLEDFNMLDYRIPDHIVNWFDLIFLWGTKQKQYLKVASQGHLKDLSLFKEFMNKPERENWVADWTMVY